MISKTFINYVGMGLDARVVYTVERKRTKNAFINKIIYGCVGFCNFFRSLKKFDTLSFVSETATATELSEKLNIKK
jgi:diacylglycerol kinase family enzyme